MPESPCSKCGTACLHTEGDPEPLCETCTEGMVWTRLILDIANGKVKAPEGGFSYTPGGPPLEERPNA